MAPSNEDEATAEVDEPPDRRMTFSKILALDGPSFSNDLGLALSPHSRKASLLTQALLTSPDLTPMSDADAPHLTSDGGMTSPARTTTPSPPLPTMHYTGLPALQAKDLLSQHLEAPTECTRPSQDIRMDQRPETKVEETLGRKRCISFACGKKTLALDKLVPVARSEQQPTDESKSSEVPPRRPCILRFACPMKPTRKEPEEAEHCKSLSQAPSTPLPKPSGRINEARPPLALQQIPICKGSLPQGSNVEAQPSRSETTKLPSETAHSSQSPTVSDRSILATSKASKYRTLAATYVEDDEWTNEQTAYRQKMTINDTLQKENAIRRLAEEAEEEEELEDDAGFDDDVEFSENDGESRDLNAVSDDGNESDDEEGFAESDDESEDGFDNLFWTPGLTTAATSTDHLDHIPLLAERVPSDSSIECGKRTQHTSHGAALDRKLRQTARPGKLHAQRDNSDNTDDFIIGTLDEDRPFHEAYMSSLEERKRSKQKLIPQDIDPSFPTSDPDAADDGNESEDESSDEDAAPEVGKGRPRDSPMVSGSEDCPGSAAAQKRGFKVSTTSPKRLRSPPPPRRLFGQTAHRLRSPPPSSQWLKSPPSSRRPSPAAESPSAANAGLNIHHLAERPNLTRTASLPRTANPFWDQLRRQKTGTFTNQPHDTMMKAAGRTAADLHTRGPIDIVQGLEKKKQRRREKYWRLHCQKAHAGKERERKCQPGKGAERMRELGKEMQDRFRGYGHNRANLMLSI